MNAHNCWKTFSIKKEIDEFIFHCIYEKNLSDKTIKAYKIDLNQFICHENLKDLYIKDFDKNVLKQYIQFLYEKKYKEKTMSDFNLRDEEAMKLVYEALLYLKLKNSSGVDPIQQGDQFGAGFS